MTEDADASLLLDRYCAECDLVWRVLVCPRCHRPTALDEPVRCMALSRGGALTCDRERGHAGPHRGYNAQIDEPMFWSDAAPARVR